METENIYRRELLQSYKEKVGDVFRYIPWLQEKAGDTLVHTYQGDQEPIRSVPIPVYDGTLLSFVKEMQGPGHMDPNYVYTFSRNGLHTPKDELAFIAQAELPQIEAIFDIMAKYVLGGMTKGALWAQAVENGVFLQSLLKIKELLDIWDKPLA